MGAYTAYELVGTGAIADQAQAGATARLQRAWSEPARPEAPAVGQPIARITIPRLGPDWGYTVLEGTDQTVLADGPGHYTATPMPGEAGNVAVAGHRVGQGAPFDGIGTLEACDDITIETRTSVLTYRVLPFTTSARPCPGAPALSADYADVTGREIVTPDRAEVLATVPGRPEDRPVVAAPLLTLTSCHPRYSARQRLIVHAVLVADAPKSPGPA